MDFSKIKKNIYKITFFSLSFFTIFSCSRSEQIASVSENDLFTLNYGNFEDELNLFNLASPGEVNTFITMRDGFFYISNGESKKVIELNSYGDLLSLYYNEEAMKNLAFANENAESSTKKAVSYPFNKISSISVDSQKMLYVVDILPEERQERDENRRLLLDNIVLRFDADGKFIDYIGQQGPGGTPFSLIKNIYTTSKNELVVVCSTNEGFDVFWFGANGFLLYQTSINQKSIPKLKRDEKDLDVENHFSIENIIPDYNDYKIYLKVDYYEELIDSDLRVQSGISFHKTMLYPLDMINATYEEGLEIPAYEYSDPESMGNELYEIPFEFLGITDSKWLFFIVPTDDGYLVQMIQPDSQQVVKRNLSVDHSRVLYHTISLSQTGIISGLFVRRENAEVVWWRTDSLIDSFMAN